jgi:ATP-dependent DNA ligase
MIPSASQPLAPMLAKSVATVPAADSVPGGLVFEPKWDGFRAIVYVDDHGVQIGSRGSKMLTRYFPELVDAIGRLDLGPCVLDGEIVVRRGEAGAERLDWDALSQRIHPAATRIRSLSAETPAQFIAFDVVAVGHERLLDAPFSERRARLEALLGGRHGIVSVTTATPDADLARHWLEEFEGAGLDGIVAKPLAAAYAPGKRVMLKVKHHRTADVVVLGYRVHASGSGVGSLLLGLFDGDELLGVGGASAFTDARRRELIDELDPYVIRGDDGEPLRGEGERSRFSGGKDVSFVRLDPRLVVEVRYDQMEGRRFRHTVQVERWRVDREARSCTFAQLELPVAYDLNRVLQ